MSKYKLGKNIQREIDKLNNSIDLKIIKGLSYRKEALRHKFLLSQLYYVNRANKFGNDLKRVKSNWFQRSFSILTNILL